MPNYEDRRYNAEAARRRINQIAQKPQVNPRDLDYMYKLAMIADTMERQNDRQYAERYADETPITTRNEYEMDMRRGVPGSGRGRTSYEMEDEMEMRRGRGRNARRDSRGRYMESENEMEMHYSPWGYPRVYPIYPVYPLMDDERQHYPMMDDEYGREYERRRSEGRYPAYPNQMPPYMPTPPQSLYSGGQKGEKGTVGYVSQMQHEKQHEKLFGELEHYFNEWLTKQKEFEQTQDPIKKQHALTELKELSEYVEELIEKVEKHVKTPEEKQVVTQMKQKIKQ